MIDTPTHTPANDDRRGSLFVLEEGIDDAGMARKKTLLSVPVLLQTAKERENIPADVWEDLVTNGPRIYYSLMYLSAAVMWAYYSCLSAQDFYGVQFPDTKFTFLTTLVTSWPQVLGHVTQLVLGLDRSVAQSTRFATGFVLFMAMAVCIMLLSTVEWADQTLGATLVLVCIGLTGLANSIPQSVLYATAALFPMEKYTNAVQIGNVGAGVFNVTLSTLLRLLVGGVDQTADSQKLSFYLFFSLLLVVCVVALYVYRQLMRLYCMQYFLTRSAMLAAAQKASPGNSGAASTELTTVAQRVANLVRVFRLVAGPAIAQFLVYFVTLFVYPGVACAADRVLDPRDVASKWYCAPGVIASFNYGDCLGRVLCSAAVYRVFTMRRSLALIVLRLAFIPLLLLNVYGSSLYVFGSAAAPPLLYGLAMTMLVGLSCGLLGTVTMGAAPLLVGPEDRAAVSAVMVLFLFLGISVGSLAGYLVTAFHLFGL